jgi:acyl-CoA thioester hydrolase
MTPEFRYHRRVQFAETDLAGIVHFSWYFRYMEEAEHALWRAAGLSISPEQPTTGWPRVAAAFDYKSPLRFEEEFYVAVRLSAVSRRTLQYGFIVRRGETVIGHGLLTAACVTKVPGGGMQSIDLPRGLVERLRGAMTEPASMERTADP